MVGVQELQQGQGAMGSLGELNPSVAAPKIRRFCEQHLALVGKLLSSRLMLELSPFMDSSVEGTSAAPTSSTREDLVAARRRLDEVCRHTALRFPSRGFNAVIRSSDYRRIS